MGWIHAGRFLGVTAVAGLMMLLARGPLGAQEKVIGSPAKVKGDKPDLPSTVKLPQPSAGQSAAVPPPVVQLPSGHVDLALASLVSSSPVRFTFKIDPKTPLADLLPAPPTARRAKGPVLADDLTQVPEISFQEPLARGLPPQESLKRTAHTIAKINHLNRKKTDAFMEALLASRRDLSGLPFAMGESCRMKQERSRHFQQALNTIRQAMGQQGPTFAQPMNFMVSSAVVPAAGSAIPPPAPAAPRPSGPKLQPAPASPAQPPAPQVLAEPVLAARTSVAVPAMPPAVATSGVASVRGSRESAEQFWQRYRAACLNEDATNAKFDSSHREHVALARIAALMQVLAPESASMRTGLVTYLATISHPEATRALARLAIFSKERGVREAACDALKVRRERDYTDVLLTGLNYPWPAVAKHAAEAIVKLERKDLIPKLLTALERPDPRLPVTKKVGDKSTTVVRELVRVNHHRNCLMCHAPTNNSSAGNGNVFTAVESRAVDGKIINVVTTGPMSNPLSPDVLTAQVPVPDEPLPTPSQGYGNSQPDTLVRIDVTYLRQDFSELQSVANAHPWPEMQRFDFLIRSRTLTEEEAQTYREELSLRGPGRVTPYQRVALAALRDLTGRDTEPTAQAWRRLLELPE
jgi:hypothetical protein